jgi:hypothetical protein
MRMEEIIPKRSNERIAYEYAKTCLDEAREAAAKFIHIRITGNSYIDAPQEFVYIWHNGLYTMIRADEGPCKFSVFLDGMENFGSCDGSDYSFTWDVDSHRRLTGKVKP